MVNCDGCGKDFKFQAWAESTGAGEVSYFACPHCGRRYDVALVTPEGLRLRDLMRQVESIPGWAGNPRLRRRYATIHTKYKQQVTSLIPTSHPVAPSPSE
jgi:DNA-directed RNA polymerase subunit RPC12/RpoP